ncbi:hypothetical protein [Rhizobium leguminosarum]|uniref:hypothetical protein n=1 Tax=Rhizobium leguminosarum TaxID=384 RepID=UPI00103BDEE9|nr:hypothetical protein [Rhizobium leguminosarum]TCA03811.1 hypothetical protein E0H63_15950 [Rhizobium leguminosarum bv. viciae]
MNNTIKLAGVGLVACAACCAVPLLSLVGAGAAAVGATAYWGPVALMAALALGSGFMLTRRRVAVDGSAVAMSAASECGCGSCSTNEKAEAPIACTLNAGDLKIRTAQIEALALRHLKQVSREPLSIQLTYAIEALPELRDLVAKETECCAFLDFDLKEDRDGVRLRITAPEAARDATDTLFAHFAPPIKSQNLETAR